MAETPETPTPSLAERLDRFRIVIAGDGQRSIVMNPQVSDEDRTAAAAQLRQLDRIKAALPPGEIIERMVVACRTVQAQGRPKNVEWFDWVPTQLGRLRDALEADDGA